MNNRAGGHRLDCWLGTAGGDRLDAGPISIRHAVRLRGEPNLPGDKSISHRALLLAALTSGESRITGASDGEDVRTTADLLRLLGVGVERGADANGLANYHVISAGFESMRVSDDALDCRNSGTTLRLLAGILAGLPARSVLDGDASLRRRPVTRIIEPLRSMGATLHARRNDSLPPLTVVGRTPLRAIDVTTSVPSAQVKSAILLAALRAEGRTTVRESIATRDHTERMLRARGVPVSSEPFGPEGGGVSVSIEGGGSMEAIAQRIPADVSAASFWLVAGAAHPDAELTLCGVGINPTRRAIIDLMRRMGARIQERPTAGPQDSRAGGAAADGVGEPAADLVVSSSSLEAIDLKPADVVAAIDELPILCLAATQARGRTTIRGAGELRHKESDRLSGIAAGLRALGAQVSLEGDDLAIEGPTRLVGAATSAHDDHRLAMTFAIAGLLADGHTVIDTPRSAAISYPDFFRELEGIRS